MPDCGLVATIGHCSRFLTFLGNPLCSRSYRSPPAFGLLALNPRADAVSFTVFLSFSNGSSDLRLHGSAQSID
jgi:hypothetical protein